MKPFFSIRIEYNPADADDESHRDRNLVRMAVARQTSQEPEEGQTAEQASENAAKADQSNVVTAVVRTLRFLDRSFMDSDRYDFIEDVIFELANYDGLEETVIMLAETAIDGCDEDFLDRLQSLIDAERKKEADAT